MATQIFKSSFLGLLAALLLASGMWAQTRLFTLQIASEPSEAEARAIIADLKTKGIEAYLVKAEVPGKGTRYRVRVGKFWSQAEAKKVADRAIGQNLIKEFIVTLYETPTSVVANADTAARREPKAKPAKEIAATKPVSETNPEKSVRASIETTPETKPEPKPELKVEAAPGARSVAKSEAKVEEAPNPTLPPASGDPAIATPPVPEALADVAIGNDNWKVVRRSAETDKNLRSLYFVDAMTGWAAGDSGAVYRTTDSGRTWKPLLSGAPANINHIHFVDWNHGWMLGESGSRDDESETVLFMTVNGGKTWTRKPLSNVSSVHFTDAKNGWAVGRNATLMKTSDGGNEWVKVDSMEKLIGLPVESSSYNYGFRDIQFVDARNGWLIGNFYGRARSNIGGIFMTTDGGVTWKRVPVTIQTQYTSGRFTPGVFHSIKFSDLNTGSVTGEMYDGEGRFFFVLHTKDGGKTWEQFRTPSRATHSTQFLDLTNGWSAASAPREGSADAVVYDTTLMRTDNGGMSWRNDFIAKGRRIRSVFFISPTKGWAVGDRGMILRYEEKAKAN